MKKTVKMYVEVKVEESNAEKRAAEVAHLKQQANTYGAVLEFSSEENGVTTLRFKTEKDATILKVILSN